MQSIVEVDYAQLEHKTLAQVSMDTLDQNDPGALRARITVLESMLELLKTKPHKVPMLDHDPPKDPEALLRENLDLRRFTEELKRECDRLRAGRFNEGDHVSYGAERKYLSKRGFPLIWSMHEPPIDHAITAEFYLKWYELYIVHPDGRVEELQYESLEAHTPPGESTYRDHTPNPRAVHNFAEANNWSIDLIFWEVLRGRWKDESEL